MAIWLRLNEGLATGAVQMARDRELLQSYQPGISRPILRFYQWAKPSLSIGRLQQVDPDLQERCNQFSIPLVKRPTGGQAILHDGDFTFSVIASTTDGFAPGVLETYLQISNALITAFSRLGLHAQIGHLTRPNRSEPHCFQQVTGADIQVRGQKLVGSAQYRRRQTFLQQSVIYLTRSPWEAKLFPGTAPAICYLNDLLPEMTAAQLQDELSSGFENTFE